MRGKERKKKKKNGDVEMEWEKKENLSGYKRVSDYNNIIALRHAFESKSLILFLIFFFLFFPSPSISNCSYVITLVHEKESKQSLQ